ncbi:MAG: hypothetical protein DCC59_02650 [Chloroflexi bacterium]|nr:hypothetical protein [Chloroflexi bacterium CFX1]MCK6568389.1 hypothetical protein [Anaerolineales bacterium]MDL1919536.1 hypothetical protein [Chloroflexi bacterium CFX5]NUQ58170.1 hypothetical protein [Anaerolineales bacterium]RIK54862.1 MAG: hypothetical protein DCC59_02650 [Chloroflexota bacterium]
MPLTSRERVQATINHEVPDRVPLVIGASNATGINMVAYRRLKKLLGVESPDRYIYDFPELGASLVDEEVLQRLRADVRGVWDREPQHILEKNAAREPGSMYYNSWGSGVVKAAEDSWFPHYHPLSETHSIEDLEKYPWPDMNDPTRVAHVRAAAQKLHAENQYAIMGTPWLAFPVERAYEMQRMDRFYYNLGRHPDFAVALLQKTNEMCKTLMGHFLDECGDVIDIIKVGDDLGMKTSLMLSPKMYRKLVKPIHADYLSFIKSRTKAKVFFHTDGDVWDLLPDFIEMGIDILNPIQSSAGKMSQLEELKKQYGKQLIFCGAIDTSNTLPFGTPDDVRAEVKRNIGILGEGGGYMVAAVHTVMADVPAENILAMADAVEEFGWYKK